MTDRDPSLDMALRLLGSADAPTPTDDDARFAKRVAGALAQRKAKPSEIDDALAAPLPDDHRESGTVTRQAVGEADIVEERGDAAYAADDQHDRQGEDRSWEGAISRPPQSGTVSSLDGLARLTRSGPHPSVHAPVADDAGMAKGPDSGLIDLRGLSKSGETPAAQDDVVDIPALTAVAPAAPAANKPQTMSAPPATSTSAAVSPTSAAARSAPTSAAAAASAPAKKKKGGAGLWIGVTTFAAAAAAAVFFVNMKRNAPTSQETRSADVANAKASTAPAPTTTTTDTATATTLASASAAPPPDDSATVATSDDTANANDPGDQKAYVGSKKPTSYGTPPPTKDTGTVAAKPTASATVAPTATTTSTGSKGNGSLDDVLGLNKPAVPTATVAVTPDLPDKPEQIDIRSAVNSKVGAASSCVAGLDGASKVTISFSPAGTVSGVVVTSGPAKGTGAEACIKSAFSSAKVPRSKLGGTGFTSLGGS